jgi:parallel beta-helix repeat protein
MRTLISIFQEAERSMKRIIMSVPFYTVLLLLCLGGLPAHAATFYVRIQGNDATPCTQARNASTPRKTINAGIACLSGGDTLIVGGGTYAEGITDYTGSVPPSGSSWTSPTTLKAAPGEVVWLRPTTTPGGGGIIEFDAGSTSYIVIDGLNIDAVDVSAISIGIGDAHHIRFQNMEVKNTQVTAIKVNGPYCEFLHMTVHHNAFNPAEPAVGGHGFYVSTDHTLIDHCRVYDNKTNGIQLTCEGCPSRVHDNIVQNSEWHDNDTGIVVLPNNTLINNVVYNNRFKGIHIGNGSVAYNNTLYNNGDAGFLYEGNSTLKNNIAIGHTWDILNNGGSGVTSNNLCTSTGAPGTIGCTHAATAAATFVSASTQNFHLRAGSPAIGIGLAVPTVTVDKDGVTCLTTGAVDVGAYQYAPAGPVLPAPQHLRAVIQ